MSLLQRTTPWRWPPAQTARVDLHAAVEASGSEERVVEDVPAVRGSDDDDAGVPLETVHFSEDLVQRLGVKRVKPPAPFDRGKIVIFATVS